MLRESPRILCLATLGAAPLAALVGAAAQAGFAGVTLRRHHIDQARAAGLGDDAIRGLLQQLPLGAVMIEALSLALPLYPRAPGEGFDGQIAAAPDAEPLTDEKLRPFADLAAMMKAKGDKNDAS